MKKTNSVIVVLVTVPQQRQAKTLALRLLQQKIAACVSVLPQLESTYWWEGKIESSKECLLLIKTKRSLLNALEKEILRNHPYKTPEIISLPIKDGYAAYLNWITKNTR